ncbi:RapZ C-terminal domain-containing protein [Saccharothrix deserti]|uniref:RapZ C-terminal domain-containing protein n=1 Tax=Saccharothrix deserti TaxID=2593674 RepID=UPI00192E7005|nr:RNase adapter RapZ [Saccharothrix deserti]
MARRFPWVWVESVPWATGTMLTRGTVDGLPLLTWGHAPRDRLATRRQLRARVSPSRTDFVRTGGPTPGQERAAGPVHPNTAPEGAGQESTSMSDTDPNLQPTAALAPVRIVSFGYLHDAPPQADLTVDVRRLLRDPARVRDAGLLDLDGRDTAVRDVVLNTPGAGTLLDTLRQAAYVADIARKPVTIAFGCAGGRHRSVALAEVLAALLRHDGVTVELDHLHVHLPRVLRDGDDHGQVTP